MISIKYKLKFNKNFFEREVWDSGGLVCGIDEVGRGCLAGPVMVGAVILPPNKNHALLQDSKLLTSEQREKAFRWITKHCWYSVALIHNRCIDKKNIYQATLNAMKRAFLQLMVHCPHIPHAILVDAMPLDLADTAYKDLNVYYFPFGERKSSSIAAASIVAKVSRDRLMAKFDPVISGYHFAQHKGYATPEHKKAVRCIGYSIIHRLNFLEGWGLLDRNQDFIDQQSIIKVFK